ncbi:MAG: CCR4-NOT regulatory complex component, partial [Lichina confinis]
MGGNQYPDGRAAAPEAVSGREEATHQTPPSIQVRNLNYAFPDGTSGLEDVRLSFPAGSRTLLIG